MKNQPIVPQVCLMTLDEYKRTALPTLKEWEKFIKMNFNSFKKTGWGIADILTFDEIIDKYGSESATANAIQYNKHCDMKQIHDNDFLTKKDEIKNRIILYFGEIGNVYNFSDLKTNKKAVRYAYDKGYYKWLLDINCITFDKLNEISLSVGILPPKSLIKELEENKQIKEQLHPDIKEHIDKMMSDSILELTKSTTKYLDNLLSRYESKKTVEEKNTVLAYNPDLRRLINDKQDKHLLASELASNSVEPFHRKLYVKFSGLVKKHEIESIKIIGSHANNTININLKNKMTIQCINKIVYNTSVLGNPYVQFPTIFMLKKDSDSKLFPISESELKKSTL